jgi:tetratricopeptide (TPR) repeat protein
VAAALQWARTTHDPLAVPLAVGRTMVLAEQGHLREALEVSEPLADVMPTDPDLHAWTIACRVYPTLFLNRLTDAQDLAHRAVRLAVQPLTHTQCLEACGLAHVFAGDAETGLKYHLQATAVALRLDPATLAGALCLQAQAQLSGGDLDGAEETLAESLRIGAPVDANYLWKRGDLAMARGRPEEALEHYVSSIAAAHQRHNQLQIMFDLAGAAMSLASLRRDADALELVGMLRAEVFELGGVEVELIGHVLGGEEIAAAKQRQGSAATAEHLARGRSVPAAERIAHVYALARLY